MPLLPNPNAKETVASHTDRLETCNKNFTVYENVYFKISEFITKKERTEFLSQKTEMLIFRKLMMIICKNMPAPAEWEGI